MVCRAHAPAAAAAAGVGWRGRGRGGARAPAAVVAAAEAATAAAAAAAAARPSPAPGGGTFCRRRGQVNQWGAGMKVCALHRRWTPPATAAGPSPTPGGGTLLPVAIADQSAGRGEVGAGGEGGERGAGVQAEIRERGVPDGGRMSRVLNWRCGGSVEVRVWTD